MMLNIYWVRGLNKKYSEAKDYLILNIDSSKVKQMHPTDHFMMTSPCQPQECREDSAGSLQVTQRDFYPHLVDTCILLLICRLELLKTRRALYIWEQNKSI